MSRTLACALLAVSIALFPSAAGACVLNSQSSLSANGYSASTNFSGSASKAIVPFVFSRVYGDGRSIRFAENVSDLKKSLSAAALAHPFLWRWGDGTYSVSRTPSHVYRHVGTYLISVFAYQPADSGAWSPFDRAQLRIVPPGEVWRDNLGQDALDLFSLIVVWGARLVVTSILALLAWGYWRDWHGRRVRSAGTRDRVQHAGTGLS